MITETNAITGKKRTRLPYAKLGEIMIATHGKDACQRGYGTTEPEQVGIYALQFGDIRPDGELN